ncbi:unnamed protein product [Pieris macdunnoughi]|uniref:Uncharacterized protein n=1 Tax=Pieris macdunnoughi TaxID=345717 RepID=A0A821NJZ9_9NEOP|nr:unnamed protein product [Pieris macdunnoughi]
MRCPQSAASRRMLDWASSSRLTLESNYNDRRRNPSLGGLPGEACQGWRSNAYTHSLPLQPSSKARGSTSQLALSRPPRNNPICKNPPISRTADGLMAATR